MTDISFKEYIAEKDNLQRVLDSLKVGIIAHDLQRRIFVFNKEAERITGYDRSEVLGRDCHKVFKTPLCGRHCSFCDSGTFTGDRLEYPLVLTARSGSLRNIEMSLTAMRGDDNQLIGVLASLQDVTDLVSLKQQAERRICFSNIIGKTRVMQQIFDQIRDVAVFDYPVHISGETGTGKELVAAAIHNESRRADAPFVPINCGALPESLIESELFGHVKGAFSGAVKDKKGRFELADSGTVFLDEVAELSKHMQVKLLRVLQEGAFEKVGGEKTVVVDIRIVSATNKNLREEVQAGHFRDDLYYRLNVVPMVLPPLRDRKTDIPLLVEHFLKRAMVIYPQEPIQVSEEAMALLIGYDWPGNVRELQNAVQFAIVKKKGREIRAADLPPEIRQQEAAACRRGKNCKLSLHRVKAALSKTGGNKAKAARSLGVGRATLYRFLNAHPELLEAITSANL